MGDATSGFTTIAEIKVRLRQIRRWSLLQIMSGIGRKRFVFSLLLFSLPLVFVFQNCGKAGFDSVSSGGLTGLVASSSSHDVRFKQAPFPLDFNVNQIAYMSCPAAAQRNRALENSLLPRSTFNVRAGSYDNLNIAEQIGSISSLSDLEKSRRTQAGITIRPEFVRYVEDKFKRADLSIQKEVLISSLGGSSLQPHLALVNFERSRMEGGFGWDYTLIRSVLPPVSHRRFIEDLIALPVLQSPSLRRRSGFFSRLDPSQRSLVTSLSWTKNEVDARQFLRELRNNLVLVTGFAPEESKSILELVDPSARSTADNVNRLLGRGYQFLMSSSANNNLFSAPDSRFLVGIEELDMSTKPPTPITAQEGQGWDCFSLIIVRHIDRTDLNDPLRRPYCAGMFNDPTCRGIRNGRGQNNAEVFGVRYVCPSQGINSLNQAVTINGRPVYLNRIRLEVARRFLPPEYWEINTDPLHMCAVLTELGEQYGRCYASGDTDEKAFIQYSINQVLPNGSIVSCGTNGANECPSFVSICYRYQ
ncbi:MAG: hypothetical protein NZ480_09360 [Bdellovibrionaceae bacterium]|nr:hypothetical protein [Pseudobdellovibrionaceae bacterium]MDW8189756.1 hypothetical protein [Pseudobdellovibrionaceae bacterium]